ncbi:MAG: flagellar export chaperone FliS [Candidatus Acidiferrum sp.]
MKSRDSASAYHRSTAFGATAVGQVITLYDTILRDLHQAIDAIDGRQIEERVNAANHALIVIGELQGVLDFEQGGETARHLNNFYNVSRAMLTHASVTSSREKFQELISMFARIRSAWSHVERTVAPSEPTRRLKISSERQVAFSQAFPDPLTMPGGSGNGRWKA